MSCCTALKNIPKTHRLIPFFPTTFGLRHCRHQEKGLPWGKVQLLEGGPGPGDDHSAGPVGGCIGDSDLPLTLL